MPLPLASDGDPCSVVEELTVKSVKVCNEAATVLYLPLGIGLGEEGGFRSSYLNKFQDLMKNSSETESEMDIYNYNKLTQCKEIEALRWRFDHLWRCFPLLQHQLRWSWVN